MADYRDYDPITKDEQTIINLRKQIKELQDRPQKWDDAYALGLKHGAEREKERFKGVMDKIVVYALEELNNG